MIQKSDFSLLKFQMQNWIPSLAGILRVRIKPVEMTHKSSANTFTTLYPWNQINRHNKPSGTWYNKSHEVVIHEWCTQVRCPYNTQVACVQCVLSTRHKSVMWIKRPLWVGCRVLLGLFTSSWHALCFISVILYCVVVNFIHFINPVGKKGVLEVVGSGK